MDYTIGKEQEMLRKSAREFFEKECPKDKVRELKSEPKAYDAKMWKKMVKLGFQGLIIPEAYGGMDGDFVELALFMEEVGRNIVPMPYYATIALCALPLIAYGNDEQKENYLPGIAEKGDIWTLARTEAQADNSPSEIQLSAVADGDEYLLNGTKIFVPYAHVANMMLVAGRTSEGDDPPKGITLFAVDPKSEGVKIEIIPTVARDGRCEVVFENVRVAQAAILGQIDRGWEILDEIQQQGALLKAAEMSGGAQAAFEITLNYTKERKQFDKPIGSYQGVQFRLVDMLTSLDSLKYLVYNGAWQVSVGEPSRLLNSSAKAKANEVYDDICHHGIYLHGAIGWTEEMDIGLYHLRTRSMIYDCGGTDLHLESIACELENDVPDFIKLYGPAS
ncbi:MAG: acyl-CoA/acyl-ACP dehydrogenase [Deltaproteobacteria bacterium]|jgi:alkylation response protein AidB-like acyl-CoA dehydrogenase|nr:acyl-CoA/acyl-ACP dehydrogenase [Deltaproteobacteria bacterium]MBT4268315.1 acyl-CoA/acyl-ACP dehydrogenase [Deltaproteobacteria bacterium]MBT4642298.1 acyl-CoA/acyl-ACP dehydrogenase [Deltaproteobacteria bacterium]MBT6498952.1 acyl-CoA/acyl-ACP dehydrogenase [Deltaproteobacteria bacterium]MBT7152059.1 acyl-CoA/acyl-ACP dehydrogenase [Deltaproteobacteria bacterium]